jgi:hypothetical protein
MKRRIAVALEEISSVYSGRARACCCGGAGTHRYPSTTDPKWFKTSTGTDLSKEDINDVQVKRIMKLINLALANNDHGIDESSRHIALETEKRIYIIYFKKEG